LKFYGNKTFFLSVLLFAAAAGASSSLGFHKTSVMDMRDFDFPETFREQVLIISASGLPGLVAFPERGFSREAFMSLRSRESLSITIDANPEHFYLLGGGFCFPQQPNERERFR
jgi:hypothetical protein